MSSTDSDSSHSDETIARKNIRKRRKLEIIQQEFTEDQLKEILRSMKKQKKVEKRRKERSRSRSPMPERPRTPSYDVPQPSEQHPGTSRQSSSQEFEPGHGGQQEPGPATAGPCPQGAKPAAGSQGSQQVHKQRQFSSQHPGHPGRGSHQGPEPAARGRDSQQRPGPATAGPCPQGAEQAAGSQASQQHPGHPGRGGQQKDQQVPHQQTAQELQAQRVPQIAVPSYKPWSNSRDKSEPVRRSKFPCRSGTSCFRRDCKFTHPPKQLVTTETQTDIKDVPGDLMSAVLRLSKNLCEVLEENKKLRAPKIVNIE